MSEQREWTTLKRELRLVERDTSVAVEEFTASAEAEIDRLLFGWDDIRECSDWDFIESYDSMIRELP